jgi:predicted nucleic acid-binding protein
LTRLVVADTSPVRYLHLIGQISLLNDLFGSVYLPTEVHAELCNAGAPYELRAWAGSPPEWLRVAAAPIVSDPATASLHLGERAALALAEVMGADLMLIDERKAARIATQKGLTVTGTLGVLDLAGRRDLIDIGLAVERLKATNFRYRPEMLDALLERHRSGR